MNRRTGSTHSMRGLLGETLARRGLKVGVNRARSVLLWPQVVGPELARLTRARNQHGTTLFVEARDSAQAHHLSMQRHHVLARLQQALGDESVTELRFVVGTPRPEETVVVQDVLPPPTGNARSSSCRTCLTPCGTPPPAPPRPSPAPAAGANSRATFPAPSAAKRPPSNPAAPAASP